SLLFAPNEEIVDQLATGTGKPCIRMAHGVDSHIFHPRLRDRTAGPFTIGYVGRLSAEKSVRNLARLEQALRAMGHRNFCIVIAGQGREEQWLRKNLGHAKLRGVLRGEELSRAFANMDVLAFPSETDTFGLVVLEALASGVPAVVTALGGPKYSVQHGETGYIAHTFDEFVAAVATLMARPDILSAMRKAARRYAQLHSWEHAFQEIYRAYADCIAESSALPAGALIR
ncbi:MAG: glycosyltransferase, partial [Acidobacteriaceae bacterium]